MQDAHKQTLSDGRMMTVLKSQLGDRDESLEMNPLSQTEMLRGSAQGCVMASKDDIHANWQSFSLRHYKSKGFPYAVSPEIIHLALQRLPATQIYSFYQAMSLSS